MLKSVILLECIRDEKNAIMSPDMKSYTQLSRVLTGQSHEKSGFHWKPAFNPQPNQFESLGRSVH
jgi:hypothetical protein